MRIEYRTKIEIAVPGTKLSAAKQKRFLAALDSAMHDAIMQAIAGTASPKVPIRARMLRSSLGLINLDPTVT